MKLASGGMRSRLKFKDLRTAECPLGFPAWRVPAFAVVLAQGYVVMGSCSGQ